jgi:hypothetical protein
MTARWVRAVLVTTVFAVAGALLGAGPAQAAAADHCLVAVGDSTVPACYATFDEARAAFQAMGGQVSEPKPPSGAARAGLIPFPTLLFIGYDWTNQNPLGGTVWYYGWSGGCTFTTADVDYQDSALSASWTNRITSTALYSGCYAKLFDLTGFGGSSTSYQGSTNSIGVTLNNDASSIRWS